MEVKTPPIIKQEGDQWTFGCETAMFEESHTIGDIVRYAISQSDAETVAYIANQELAASKAVNGK